MVSLSSSSSIQLNALFLFCSFIAIEVASADQNPFGFSCHNWNEKCPPASPIQNCVVDPCSVAKACPKDSGFVCHSNYCGGCRAICCPEIKVENQGTTRDLSPIVCAQDVQECSDGSWVSRDPERFCQFEPCPEEAQLTNNTFSKVDDDLIFCTMDVKTCWDGSWVSRDTENNCAWEPCPPFSFSRLMESPLMVFIVAIKNIFLL